MSANFKIMAVASIYVSISACAGLTAMQSSLSRFGAGATAIAATQMSFFSSVQALDCSAQFYDASAQWALGVSSNYDITGSCAPTTITNAQLAVRQHILDALTAYAEKMAALASTGGDKSLDSNGQNLAKQLNALAGMPGGITKSDAKIGADVEGAVIALANMALDQARYREAKKAASEMSPYLKTIVAELEAENIDFAVAIDSERGKLELTLRKVVDLVPSADPPRRFAAVVGARDVIRSANPFGEETLSPASGIPTTNVRILNVALGQLVSANDAIATANEGSITAAVTDLVTRAQSARADVVAISQ